MNFTQIASGSGGNFYIVTAQNGNRILIDMGIPWLDMLAALDYKTTNIEFALLDHLHKDHSKSLKDVIRAGIDVYASKETFESQGLLGRRKVNVVEDKTLIRVKGKSFNVFCFSVKHDCEGNLGFVVYEVATKEYLLFVTDTPRIKQKFPHAFSIIAIECSYNGPYLKHKVEAGEYPEKLAKRLLDSHMEESETMNYLQNSCDLSQCGQVHLLHLSASNVHKQRLVKKFQEQLFIDVITV